MAENGFITFPSDTVILVGLELTTDDVRTAVDREQPHQTPNRWVPILPPITNVCKSDCQQSLGNERAQDRTTRPCNCTTGLYCLRWGHA